MSREEKVQAMSELLERIQQSSCFILTHYSGLKAGEINALRQQLRASRIHFQVVKNTVLRMALHQAGLNGELEEVVQGPLAVAIGYGDPVEAPKLLTQMAKDLEALSIVGGVVDGVFCDASTIKGISQLPPRSALMGQVCGAILSPIYGITFTIQTIIASIVEAIQQIGEKLSGSEVKEQAMQGGQQGGQQGGKEMSTKVEELFEGIKTLTLWEAKQLYEKLQQEFGITGVAAAPVVTPTQVEAVEAPSQIVEEQTEFTVMLREVGEAKVQVIKTLRELIPGLGLKEAKEIVESAPSTVKEGANKEEAQKMREKLEAVGAKVEVK